MSFRSRRGVALVINRSTCTCRKANKQTKQQLPSVTFCNPLDCFPRWKKGKVLLVPSDRSAPNLEPVVRACIRVAPVTRWPPCALTTTSGSLVPSCTGFVLKVSWEPVVRWMSPGLQIRLLVLFLPFILLTLGRLRAVVSLPVK